MNNTCLHELRGEIREYQHGENHRRVVAAVMIAIPLSKVST